MLVLGRLLPEELELFYDSWKNIVTINRHAQSFAAYKSVEVITYFAYITVDVYAIILFVESFGVLP